MEEKRDKKIKRFNLFYLMATLFILFAVQDYFAQMSSTETLPYSEFLQRLHGGGISEVVITADKIYGKFRTDSNATGRPRFEVNTVNDPRLVGLLEKYQVKFSRKIEPKWIAGLLSWVLPLMLLFLFWRFMFQKISGPGAGSGFLSIGKAKVKVYIETDLQVSFDDVAGIEEAKEELEEVVQFLKNPSDYGKLGGRLPKGILLVGPPGTGKTLLARAVAGEAKVPFFSINGSEFVEMFVGVGAARVRDLFEQAKKHSPCIIFIDELDALGRSRSMRGVGGGNDEKEQTLNQLLAELDGFDSTKGVILLAATNRPEILDQALLRAGRFDRQVLVDKPDKEGRKQILEVHLKKIVASENLDREKIAQITTGLSGADMANLVNEAALVATRRKASEVEQTDFLEAIERVVAGLEKKKASMSSEEKNRVAYHELGHATVGLALETNDKVHKISIVPRGMGALGYTMQHPTKERYLWAKKDLLGRIAILLGGRAAEELFFGDISTGASDDLQKAGQLARGMVLEYGMSDKLGPVTFQKDYSPFLQDGTGGDKYREALSEKTSELIDSEVKSFIEQSYEQAIEILKAHRPFILMAVETLLTKETLEEEEIAHLWASHRPIE